MEDPKKEIYDILKTIVGINVYQNRPEVLSDIEETVSVTFYISSNVPAYNLGKTIAKQDVEVAVDIWGRNSMATGPVMEEVEAKMIAADYRMTGNLDIPDPDGYSHLSLRFSSAI